MAMTKLFDLAVKTGEYTDRQGNSKGRWENVGSVMRGDEGNQFLMLKKTFNPAGVEGKPGSDAVLISCFEPRDRNQQGGNSGGSQGGGYQEPDRNQRQDLDDEIPF